MKRNLSIRLSEGENTQLDITVQTEKTVQEVLAWLSGQANAADVTPTQAEADKAKALEQVGKKYRRLAEYLYDCERQTLRLSFAEIEEILGQPLPATASGEHARSWWANTESHSQGRAWMAAGYKVYFLDIDGGAVEWQKM